MLSPLTRDSSRSQALRRASAPDDSGWMITLCDLTMLLLCFALFWYMKSRYDSLTAPASPPTVAQKTLKKKSSAPTEAQQPLDWNLVRKEVERYVAQLGLAGEVGVESTGDEMIVSLKEAVPFTSGRADLRPRALPVLEKVAAIALSRDELHLEVGGHTDDRPIASARFPSNWELSSARASAVARYLIEKGVRAGRLEVQGFANTKPRVPNTTSQSRSINRRVEIRLFQARQKSAVEEPKGN